MIELTDLRAQRATLEVPLREAIDQVVAHGGFIQGPEVTAFEEAYASWCGTEHAIGVSNGTDALTLALRALRVGAGDEVVVPVNTYVASAEAIALAGATPVFVDVDPQSHLVDVSRIEAALTDRTRAVMPVHLFGAMVDLDPILELAVERDLRVIEDASQAHGARDRGRRAGSIGDVAGFSFYPSKNLGAYGDAGAVVTSDDDVVARVRRLQNHGGTDKYRHDILGTNARLDTLQAAILLVKLGHLDGWNEARRKHAARYDDAFSGVDGLEVVTTREETEPVHHLYVIRVPAPRRDALREDLAARGIGNGVHYPQPLHLTGAFAQPGSGRGSFPVAEDLADRMVSLPMYAELSGEQVDEVAEAVRSFFGA